MLSKTCMKCHETKSIVDYYKHDKMADGHLNKCKECTKLDNRKNRWSNINYYREYDRKRVSRVNKENQREYKKEYAIKYPKECKARSIVANCIKRGELTRPSHCQGCGDKCKPHGHHEDYSKPLDLVWLCHPCHMFIHKMYNFRK